MNFKQYFYDHLHPFRRIIQTIALVLIFIIPILNKFEINQIIGTYYSLTIGNLDLVDPALIIQSILLTKIIYFPLLLAGLIPIIVTLIFGKIFCGWICPFNFLAEISNKLRFIIKPKPITISKNSKSYPYYIILISIFLLIVVSGIPLVTYLSMPGIISSQAADFIYTGVLGIEFSLVLFILIVEVLLSSRFWCKYVCPVGAILALAKIRNTLYITFLNKDCSCRTGKLSCNISCPIKLDPRKPGIYPYCYNCGECIQACRKTGSNNLNFKFHI